MFDSWRAWSAIAGTVLVLTLMLVLPVPAGSQEAPAAAQAQAEAPPPEAIAVIRIPSRYEELDKQLATIRKELGGGARSQIEADLPAFTASVESSSSALDMLLARDHLAPRELAERRIEWIVLGRRARSWQTELGDPASQINERLEEVNAQRELWGLTRAAARERRAPKGTLEHVSSALSLLDETQRLLEAERNALMDLENRINAQARRIDTAMDRIVEARAAVRSAIFVRNAAPFWELRWADLEADLPLVGELVNVGSSRSRRYIETGEGKLIGQLLLIAALWFALRRARQAFEAAGESDPITHSANAAAWAHPVAAAWLLGIVTTRVFHPAAPQSFRNLLILTGLVPWLLVLHSMLPRAFHRHLRTLAALTALLVFYTWTSELEAFSRFMLLTLIALTLAWLLLLRRPSRLAELPPSLREGTTARFLAGWLRITTFVVAFALVAALVGYSAFAETGLLAALGGTFLLSSFVAGAGILEALLTVGLGSRALSNLRMLHTRRRLVLGVLSRAVRLAMVGTFVFAMLSIVGLAQPLVRLSVGILTAPIGYGSVQLSLGGVLAFVATIWISLKLGRLVTFVFDAEVVPRVRMAPGVPYAIATFARYTIIVFGFVIAIAMLGFQMDRLALVVSALGVGIGFGLQNVVNNFVSGIIMLFERPIRVGDRVQLDDLIGDVTSIGIRASKVRTVDGSDVIVPNSEFTSTRVINWTLSDYKRRIIVPVGVRYGTDPEQVLELLLEAARENHQVLANPEPASLFLAHGESSLDFELRVFTESHQQWMAVLSDLTVAINRKLKEAEIEIPFPQRDLHLRSADVEAARRLRGDGE